MNMQAQARVTTSISWTQAVVALAGALHAVIGDFAPFNRHYIGDLGAFTAPLGIGLLVAARNPYAYRTVVGIAALANVLHVLNHLYDDWLNASWSPEHLLTELVPLLAIAILLGAVWWEVTRKGEI